ncbi:MAG: YbbR-like domain-containing protein [Lachnospiraceae bacterium]
MKNKLTKNWGLKLGSFLFAVALWIIVTNINDPVIPYKVSDVPVTIRNANLITDKGQIYEVLDGTDVIDVVTITAPRSIIDSLDKSNVVAVADMNDLTSLNTISIKLSTNKYNEKLESIKGSIDSVKLNIEDKQTKSLPLKTNTTGEVREGYVVGDVITDQNLVRISGPKSVISQISKAVVEVDISGFTSNIGTDADIHLFDENDKEIKSGSIEKSISKVRVNVEILEIKSVPIQYSVAGVPADGYRMTGEIEGSRNYVNIAGKSKIVENVDAIEVPESAIDVTGAKENVTAAIDLKNYLPSGVILADENFSGKVNVTVFIEPEVEKTVKIDVQSIGITGVPEGYEATITDPEETCDITLVGLAAELNNIAVEEITATVDVAAWFEEEEVEEPTRGNYWIPITVQIGEEPITLQKEVQVHVHITETE